MRGAEVREGGEGGGLCSNFGTPKLCNLSLDFALPSSFGGGAGKHIQGVGKVILDAQLPYLDKPRD